MTTVQEEARERAAQELARRIAAVAPIQDPLTWARAFITDMTTPNRNGAWRYVQAPPVIQPTAPGVPAAVYADELDAVRRACEIASSKHREDQRDV